MIRKVIILFLGLLSLAMASNAQQVHIDKEVQKNAKIFFRQGSFAIDENYMGNKEILENFAQEVDGYLKDSTSHFRQIRIAASASPEGSMAINERITDLRAKAITNWVSKKLSVKLDYVVGATSIDWDTLAKMVAEDENVPYRDEVIEIINNTPEFTTNSKGIKVSERHNKLRMLRSGVSYAYIYKNIFTHLRYATVDVEFWWESIPTLEITTESPLRLPNTRCSDLITYTKSIQDDVLPTATSSADWIESITPSKDGIVIVAKENNAPKERTAIVEVSCYGKTHQVEVIQEGANPVLSILTSSPVEWSADGGNGNIDLSKNVVDDTIPTVKCDADWIESITPTSKGINYTVKPNASAEARSTTMSIECYGQTQEVVINQLTRCTKPFYMAVKTNMLYDVAIIPNVGVEFYLGKNFSVAGNWMYSWWKSDKKNWYWRTYGGDIAVRYWMGKAAKAKPLTGHHLGLYGQMITYDFQVGNKGILADRWSWAAGLEYGYSLPIARRFNIDFTLGLGYHWGKFDEYLPIDNHPVWQASKNRKYIGPTKAEVNLVWLIGCGNYNKGKNR